MRWGLPIALVLATCSSGCFVEVTGAGYVEAGGVRGSGYSYGVNVGTYVDDGDIRGALSGSASAARTSADDGRFEKGTKAASFRGDKTFAASSRLLSYRLTGEMAVGQSNLLFHATGYTKDHEASAIAFSSFLGATVDLHNDKGSFEVTLSAGPQTMTAFNDFVGTTTSIGPQARVGLWVFNGALFDMHFDPPSDGAAPSKLPDSSPTPGLPSDKPSEFQKAHERREEQHQKDLQRR